MNFDWKQLKALAEEAAEEHRANLEMAGNGHGWASTVKRTALGIHAGPDVILALLAEREELIGKVTALARDVSISRRQKSQYFRAVKWFLANTNIKPADVPTPVYHTLMHVVKTLAEKAKRAAEVANG